jgi:hypothetical protein
VSFSRVKKKVWGGGNAASAPLGFGHDQPVLCRTRASVGVDDAAELIFADDRRCRAR